MLGAVVRRLRERVVMDPVSKLPLPQHGYSLLEVPASRHGNPDGITYLVTCDGTVLFTREYIRHRHLLARTHFPFYTIAWGGVLTDSGEWVRRSYDFGDAPDPESRDTVVAIIQNKILRKQH